MDAAVVGVHLYVCVCVQSAVYHLMAANVSGFNTVPRQNNPIGLREVSLPRASSTTTLLNSHA